MDNMAPKEMRNSDGGLENGAETEKSNRAKAGDRGKASAREVYYLAENKRITLF
jgi:hypothetical protein